MTGYAFGCKGNNDTKESPATVPENEINIDEIATYLADFYQGSRIDWDDALTRVEEVFDIDLPTNLLDPIIKEIKAAYRAEIKARKE